MFGFKQFGTVYGLLMMIAAFANLLQVCFIVLNCGRVSVCS